MLNISKDEKRYTEIELDLNKKLAYEKGRASIIEELEILRKRGEILMWNNRFDKKQCLDLINGRIKELKGEDNE